jgi:hypothetical protein
VTTPTFIGASEHAAPLTIEALGDRRVWVAWQLERAGERITKVPYFTPARKARANDRSTWTTLAEAFANYQRLPLPYNQGGIGIELGMLDDNRAVGGVDLDTCINQAGEIEPWAREIICHFNTYTEFSPSGTGVKLLFEYDATLLPKLRAAMGNDWSKTFKRPGDDHPPGIEVHLGNRYFAVTGERLKDAPEHFRREPLDDLLWVLHVAGPGFVHAESPPSKSPEPQQSSSEAPVPLDHRLISLCASSPTLARLWAGDFSSLTDQSRSARAMALGAALKRADATFEEMGDALRQHPDTVAWAAEKGTDLQRQLQRIWDRVEIAQGAARTLPHHQPSLAVLTRNTAPCPQLPVAAFGPFWAQWITDAAAGANAPPDFTALPLLAVASTLIGNARWISPWLGWKEPPVLWCCAAGDPSSGKSPGAAPVMRDVLAKVEAHMARDFPEQHEAWVERQAIAAAVKKNWEKEVSAAIESSIDPPPMPDGLDIGDEPQPPTARTGNVTIEQMMVICGQQPKGVMCASDELAQWFMNFQRYAGGGSDRPFWLEAYTGGPYRVARVGRKPIEIPRLAVPIFGTIQPDRLATVLRGADDGLVGRFLWCWPEALPFRPPTNSANIVAAADALCLLADLKMAQDEDGADVPVIVPLSESAAAIFESYVRTLAERERTAHGLMKSALGKARGQILRLALVLEHLWWCGDGTVAPQSIQKRVLEAAVSLVDAYFLPNAERVFGDAVIPLQERNARLLAHWIIENRPGTVNITDVRDNARLPGLRESEAVKAACRFLAEAHWLIEVGHSGRGRPRGDYVVNPKLWEMLRTN